MTTQKEVNAVLRGKVRDPGLEILTRAEAALRDMDDARTEAAQIPRDPEWFTHWRDLNRAIEDWRYCDSTSRQP